MGKAKDRYDNQQTAIHLYRSGEAVAAICERFQITRPTFYNWLKDNAVKTTRRAPAPDLLPCQTCSKPVPRWRGSHKRARTFCSTKCYFDARKNPNFIEWHHGTRLARKAVSAVFKLRAGMVVHHLNENERDNRLENLAVFASASDHRSFHHNQPGHAEPIARFDGIPIPPRAEKIQRRYYGPRVTNSNTSETRQESVTVGNSLNSRQENPSPGERLHGHKPGCGCDPADFG